MFDRAICTASPAPPLSTTFDSASAKPFTWAAETVGGSDSASGSVTMSTSAGPSWAKASSSAPARSFGSSTRTAKKPRALATAA
jgi:hypothetical protein